MSASVSSLLQSSGRQRIIEAVVAVLALVALWLLSFTPQWRQLEFKTFDAYTALAARGPGDTPVVIIAIDEPSFRELGLHWPFPRRTHAELIERAASDGALVIAFDLLFAEATNAAVVSNAVSASSTSVESQLGLTPTGRSASPAANVALIMGGTFNPEPALKYVEAINTTYIQPRFHPHLFGRVGPGACSGPLEGGAAIS